MRGNTKPFGKRLSPCAETPNHSGNDFRHARKLQTIRETTFAKRGNTKPLVVSKKVCKLDIILIFALSNKKQQEYGTYTRTNFGNYFELHK